MTQYIILMACRNCEEWIEKSIQSIQNQTLSNWICYVLDDASEDGTFDVLQKLAKEDARIRVNQNPKRCYAAMSRWNLMQKIYHENAQSDIIVILDGDDWFADEHVLEVFDGLYANNSTLCTYGSLSLISDGVNSWSRPYPKWISENNNYREYKWLASAPYTFRVGLITYLSIEMFLDAERKPLLTGTDVALMIPILELSGLHAKFIHQTLYIYNDRQGSIFDRELRREQVWNEYFIKNRKPKLMPLGNKEVATIVEH